MRKGELVGEFSSVKVFLDFLQKKFTVAKQYKSSENTGRDSFQKFSTYEEAMDMFINKADKLVDFKEIYEPITVFEEVGNQVEYNITGDFIDIGRYMEGIPEVFGSLHDGQQRRYRANIILNLSWVYSVSEEVINKRLKKTLALVDWLEMNNVRCAIIAVESTECAHAEITVKRHEDVLDLRDLAVVSHSDFLRRAMFRFDEYSDTLTSGYGGARDYRNSMFAPYNYTVPADNPEEIEIFIDSYTDSLRDVDNQFSNLKTWLIAVLSGETDNVKMRVMSSLDDKEYNREN
jgi:hypothetical protein